MSSSTTPRVSVVIPLFQKARYVQRALESVFRQTLKDFEVIVVDDGSTDGASEMLSTITDARLIVHRQTHAGVSITRNRGVALARAPWVGFLDADDEWLSNFLESTLKVAEASSEVSAVFASLMDHRTGRPLVTKVNRRGLLVHDYFATLLSNDGMGMSSSSVLASKAHLEACGGFPEGVRHGEDIDLWARLAWRGEVAFCEETGAVWHSEVPDSASKDVQQAIASYPAFLRSYEEWNAEGRIPHRLRESSRRYATWVLARHAMELAHHGRTSEARTRLSQGRWGNVTDPILWRARVWVRLPTAALRMGRWLRTTFKRGQD